MAEKKGSPLKDKPEKIVVSPELRKMWLRIRSSWNLSFEAFSNTLSMVNPKQAEQLYGLVKLSLFKNSYVEMLREHPELREIVRTDDDRWCMHDIYEVLSWRLGKQEKLPPYKKISFSMQGKIGRESPALE